MRDDRSDASGFVAILVGAGAVAVCCGGPVLVAAIATLGISGAVLGRAAPIAGLLVVAALLVTGAVAVVRRHRACSGECETAPRPAALDRTGGPRP